MTETTGGLLADYLTEDALAKQLNVTARTLQRWRRQRVGPPVTYIGRVPYYRVESSRAWLMQREVPMVRERKRA
jgi:transcriptional regulator GlxA family with amidase domain